MRDIERKTAILQAEQEFERKENLSRALADRGVTLIGRITSPPPPEPDPIDEGKSMDDAASTPAP